MGFSVESRISEIYADAEARRVLEKDFPKRQDGHRHGPGGAVKQHQNPALRPDRFPGPGPVPGQPGGAAGHPVKSRDQKTAAGCA